jgi:IS30 family transposase
VRKLTEAEKAEIAELWAQKLPVRVIARTVGRPQTTVRKHVAAVLRRPARVRQRSALRLSLVEREDISRGLAAGESLRVIAARLGRAPSTIWREVRANGGHRRYRAVAADGRAWRQALRPKQQKLAGSELLRWLVEAALERRWSPEQIAGWLRCSFPDRPELWVSHETIYQSLYVQTRGALRRELTTHLRRPRTKRRPRRQSTYNGQGQLRGTLNISERPPEADDRAVPGHWEGDLLFGKGMTAVATLVERHSRYLMLVALPEGHRADVVADALAERIVQLPDELRRSLTWDQGKEMAAHARFSIETGLPVYFCDPRSPWQRGSNENTYWGRLDGPDFPTGGVRRDRWVTRRTRAGRLSVDMSTVVDRARALAESDLIEAC